jgi:ABC-type xylose transport system permease subunit
MILASIRPDSLTLPLFIHVLGAMILVGGLLTTTIAVLVARGDARVLRLGAMTLFIVCLPGYIIMRVGAEWIYSREHLGDLPDDPTWVGIGYITADVGALLLLISLILAGIGVRRQRKSGGTGLLRASLFISVILLAAYVVTVWAMSAKPT